jgi:hypothetical protein
MFSRRFSLPFLFLSGVLLGSVITSGVGAAFKGSSVFRDVPTGHFADDAIGEMVSLGIIKGMNATTFAPNEPVTRAQLAVLFKRLRDDILKNQSAVPVSSSSRSSSVASSASSLSSSASVSSSVSSSSSSSSSSSTGPLPYNAGGYVHFGAREYNIDKNDATGLVTVVIARTGGNSGLGTVDYAFNTGTAVADKDYQPLTGTLTFNNKETSKKIQLKILNNTTDLASRTITLKLSNPTGAIKIGTPNTITVNIRDPRASSSSSASTTGATSSSPTTAVLSWSALQYGALENGGSLTITVVRSGITTTAAEASYTTVDGTARSGTDYASTSGKVTFAANETTKTFTIALVDNGSIEGNRTLSLQLSSPASGTSLGTATATVAINDNDAGIASGSGSFKFSASSYTVLESRGEAVITVNRIGGFGSASVSYQATGGSAVQGTDFTATSGTLNFAQNETTKTFIIPLVIDTVTEDSETINLSLSSPARASLSDPSIATIFVQG